MKPAGKTDNKFRIQAIAVVALTICAMVWVGADGDDDAADGAVTPAPAQPRAVVPGPAEDDVETDGVQASILENARLPENGSDVEQDTSGIYDEERNAELQDTVDRMMGLAVDDDDEPEAKPGTDGTKPRKPKDE
ncbi:MAG: hypothetical protein ACYTGN_01315 [Planctomycetota bacterium]|jgi:hypothetical protein